MYRKGISVIAKKNAKVEKYLRNNPYLGMPSFVQLEVTTKCNINCKLCLRNIDPARVIDSDMPLDLFESIIRQLKGGMCNISIVGMGEPLLHPEIFSMIRFIKQNDLQVSLIDNFTLMNREKSLALIDSGLDFLYVSFDNVSKREFEERRTGACFEKVVDNIKLFLKTRNEANSKKPVFIFKSTIDSTNYSEIPKLISFAEDIGADGINFGKTVDIEEFNIKSPHLLNIQDIPDSSIKIDVCELGKSYECDATRGCYVTFDGKVLPCGLMPEWVSRADYPKVQLGDLKVEPIVKVWRSRHFRKLRKSIQSGTHLPQCKECAGVQKNR
jgi:radical SAM protein with 4Fe4S-binding SPASM domain